MNYCMNCNELIKKSNKFCGSSCSATYNNKLRKLSEKTKLKTSEALKEFYKDNKNANYGKKFGSLSETRRTKISEQLKIYWSLNSKKTNKHDLIRLNREAVHRSRAKKLGLLPEDANIDKIKKFYLETPDNYEVDHIKPFAVGGLHHQNNLQYLTHEDNQEKGTKYSEVAQ